MSGAEAASLPAAIQDSGLVSPGSGGVVLLSGGADSCALAFGLSRLKPRPTLHAVHLNYGLRSESGEDELACSRLCERLAIELTVIRPERGSGNLHAWARQERYRAAERVRRDLGLDWIAVAHTASDLAETVVYRLAVSPGTRALAAMPSRRGAVIRPLLGLSRQGVRRAATAAELPFVDDRSNDDPAFARARIRHEVMPVLADLNPSVLEAVARTREDLAEELDFLAAAGSQLVDFDRDGSPSVAASDLAAAHPAVRRFALRSVAESALGRAVPVSRQQAAAVLELAEDPEGGRIDIGGGASLVAESGRVGVDSGSSESLGSELPAVLEIPGSLDWRGWSIEAEEMHAPFSAAGPDVATLDLDRLEDRLEVRSWRDGDRMRPLGLDGSKSLQDLFTDRRLPRSRRRRLPVLLSAGEVVWVPGIAVGEAFRLAPATSRAVRLTACRPAQAQGGPPPNGLRIGTVNQSPTGEVLISPEELSQRVAELGAQISRDYQGKDLVMVGVLRGAVVFIADLLRALDVVCEIDFMAVSSYGSSRDSSGVVRILKDLDDSITGRDVLIVEDIVDSGLTLNYLMRNLRARDPASLEVCSLLTKPERRRVDVPIRYTGFEIPNTFVVGYGLDHAQQYRHLPYVAELPEDVDPGPSAG